MEKRIFATRGFKPCYESIITDSGNTEIITDLQFFIIKVPDSKIPPRASVVFIVVPDYLFLRISISLGLITKVWK